MIEIKREGTRTLSLETPSAATNVTITLRHSWGDLILEDEPTVEVTTTSFTYDLTAEDTASCGEIKVTWKYFLGAVQKIKNEYVKVYVPYVSDLEFFEDFPETEVFEDSFIVVERRIRNVIDTYCGQSFDFQTNKTYTIEGEGNNSLHLPIRIDSLTSVTRTGAEDITEYVEISPNSSFYLRKKPITFPERSEAFERVFLDYPRGPLFTRKYTYFILGDFGWPYVPSNITEAAKILMADYLNQDSDYRRHKITFQGTGPIQTRIDPDFMGTTGNLDADILLMDYSRFVIDWI